MTKAVNQHIRPWRRLLAAATVMAAAGLMAAPAPAATQAQARQPSTSSGPRQPGQPDAVKRLIDEAYRLSREAKTIPEFDRVLTLCRQILESAPGTARLQYARQLMGWTHNKRGEANVETGDDAAALADFEAAIDLDPGNWRALHNRGVSYAQVGRYEEAIADFDRTIRLKPNYANAYFNRGELRYAAGEFRQAIDDYNRALRYAPRDTDVLNSRGHAYYRLGDYRAAVDDYSRAIQIDDRNAAAYTNRGDAYADRGNFARAAQDYRTAIEVDPNLGRAYQSAAWLMATCPDEEYRREDLAITAANRAIQLDGADDYRYLDTLAAAHANAGNFERAIETQQRVVAAAPEQYVERYRARLKLYQQGEPYRDVLSDSRSASRDQRPPAPGRQRPE